MSILWCHLEKTFIVNFSYYGRQKKVCYNDIDKGECINYLSSAVSCTVRNQHSLLLTLPLTTGKNFICIQSPTSNHVQVHRADGRSTYCDY